MKPNMEICNPELISAFFDNELDNKTRQRVNEHLKTCTTCQKDLESFASLSEKAREHLSSNPMKVPIIPIEKKVADEIRKQQLPWWTGTKLLKFSKTVLMPSVVVSGLFVFTFMWLKSPVSAGPSAIVTSLSSETASVIIMETPRSGHTILWFTENS